MEYKDIDLLPSKIEMLEVVDKNGKTVILMPTEDVKKQNLLTRVVLIIGCTADKKIILSKKLDGKNTLLDVLFRANILPKETSELTTSRIISNNLNYSNIIILNEQILGSALKSSEFSIFVKCKIPQIKNQSLSLNFSYVILDKEEFERLYIDYFEIFTPQLQFLTKKINLFNNI